MSRSRWKVPLLCPRCFETGEAILSHQHEGIADIRVEFLAPAFKFIESETTPDRVDVLCAQCNVSARRDIRVRRRIRQVLFAEFRKLLPKFPRQRKRRVPSVKAATAQH